MKYTMIVGKYINLGTLQKLLFDDEKDPYQMNNLPLEENKEIVAELCREMGKELKAIDDPWYKERILSDMIPY